MAPIITAEELLESGAHFGHHTGRWHPKMAPYIFTKRNKIHIINLRETIRGILSGYYFLRDIAAKGHSVLLVGTKYQAKEVIRKHAQETDMPFVAERWLGGTLTNLNTIRQRVKRWGDLERMEEEGIMQTLSKKVVSSLRREKRRIVRNLEGIRHMTTTPGALLIIDPNVETIAVREARKMKIPIVAILDTDCDPDDVDIPIPANDDSIRSIDLIISKLVEAIKEGGRIYERTRAELKEKTRKQAESAVLSRGKGGASVGGKKIKDVPLPSGAVSVSPVEADKPAPADGEADSK